MLTASTHVSGVHRGSQSRLSRTARPIALILSVLIGLVAVPATASAAVATPANVAATSIPTGVKVTWAAGSGLSTGTILYWEARYRYANASSTLGTKQASAGARETVFGGLDQSKSYAFQVRVVTWLGSSGWSPAVTTSPVPPPVVPAAPTAVTTALTETAGGVKVKWTPGAAVPDAPVTGFRVSATTDGVTKVVADDIAADQTETTVPVPAGKNSTVAVSAVGAGGVSAAKVSSTFFVPQYTLPVVKVETDGGAPIVSKDDYVTGTFSVAPGPGGAPTDAYTGVTEIKGRGNSTWNQPKKPYRVKLGKAASLLGLPSSKHWVLLANFLDKSHVRNSVAFQFGAQTGLAWTPKDRFVELVLNGKYVGLYQLVEQVRIDKARINIDALKETDILGDALTGGYHIERDARWTAAEEAGFISSRSQPFALKDPEVPTPEQASYIKGYVDQTEAAIFGSGFKDPSTGYASFIDVPSFIDWFLIHEFLRVNDAWYSSTNMYKPRLGKLYAGPLWDFDYSMGSPSPSYSMPPTGAWVPTRSIWFKRLLEDPAFKAAVGARWAQLRPAATALPAYLESTRQLTATAAANDLKVWGGKITQVDEANRIKAFLQTRATWMDTAYPAPVPAAS